MPNWLIPFDQAFPEQAPKETRSLTLRHHRELPDDDYGLLEAYCPDLGCHCRRAMLNIVSRRLRTTLASISYGFDSTDPLGGAILDPFNPQSTYAPVLLGLVKDVLADPAYAARLEAHYYQLRGAVSDPAHPIHQFLMDNEFVHPPPKLNRQQRRRK